MRRAKTAKVEIVAPSHPVPVARVAPRHRGRMPLARKPRRLVRGRDPAAPWSAREQARFLAGLGDGLAVAEAAAAIGRTLISALAERSRDRRFAARWDCALDSAFEVLETRLLSVAIGGVAEETAAVAGGERGSSRDDMRLAQWILAHLRDRGSGAGGASSSRGARAGGAAVSSRARELPGGAKAPLDPAAEQARIDRLIDEVAERIADAEARMAKPRPD
ncbi:hypothetical protein [Thermaurantiacus sp.]